MLHCGHCSTNPIPLPPYPLFLLLLPLLLLSLTDAWLNSLLNFDIPASAVARTDEAALRKADPQLDDEDDAAGACLALLLFLLVLKKLLNWNAVACFLGPGQL